MTVIIWRRQGDQFLDSNGVPLAGGMLYYYDAGTQTPQNTYLDSSGVTTNTNPVVLNSAGRLAAPVYLGSNADYKETLTDANGVTQPSWPADNIPRAQAAAATITGFERLYLPFVQVSAASSPVSVLTTLAGYGYEIDATSGAIEMDLPAATAISNGTGYFFKRMDGTSYAVTIKPNGTDTIDGVNASIIVPGGDNGVYLVSDGAQWLTYSFFSPEARLIGAVQNVTANGTALSINANLGWYINLTLSASVTSVAFTNLPPAGALTKITLEITSGGSYTIAGWPGTTRWVGGSAPTITHSGKDTLLLTTIDGGTNWRGYIVAQSMS
jgi:hypothetical protein